MNITNLIVELVKQGKSVELPGIGTFSGNMQQSHHDAEKHVFYPAGIKVSFDSATTGDETMIDEIAKSEFISRDIARQMWQNYIDALGDRVRQNGSHRMGEMGVLKMGDDKQFSFAMTEEVLIPQGGQQPLYDVRTYEHADEEDPFAAYEPEEVPTIAVPKAVNERPKEEVKTDADIEQAPVIEEVEQTEEQPEEPQTMAEEPAVVEETPVEEPVVVEEEVVEETAVVEETPVEEPAVVEEEVVEEPVVAEEPSAEEPAVVEEEVVEETAVVEETPVEEPVVVEKEVVEETTVMEETPVEEPVVGEEASVEEPDETEEKPVEDDIEGENNERKVDARSQRKEDRLMRKVEKKASSGQRKLDSETDKDRLKAEKRAAALAAVAEKAEAKAAAKAEEEARKLAEMEAEMNAREQERLAREQELQRRKDEIASAKELKKQEKAQKKEQKKLDKEQKKLEAEQQKELKKLEKEQQKLDAEQQARERKEREKAEKEQQKLQKQLEKQNKEAQKLADDLLNPVTATTIDEPTKKEGKGKRKCGWVVWVILLLCVAAVVAWWLCRGMCGKAKPSAEGQAQVESLLRKAYVDGIDYSRRDISDNSYAACRFVEPYVLEFLSQNNYTNARVSVMNRLQAYAEQRMNNLLGQRFAWIELVPYTNYVFDYNREDFKNSRANAARCVVQGELMNRDFLDSVLRQTVESLGLQDDGAMQRKAEEVRKVQEQERAQLAKRAANANNQLLRYVTVRGESKKGYDIIAGFYLNKHVAADLTARLYDMGCDAYIIEKNEYYYVSMGSAATRTEAEAQMKHIKEWYDGDVAIKQL